MPKLIHYSEVLKHKSKDSCWVILYGNVWDVTNFLPEHPGGSSIILKLAGKDATEEYDPIHPPGTLEDNLPESARIGPIDPKSLPEPVKAATEVGPAPDTDKELPLAALLNLDEVEAAATKKLSKKGWAYYYSAADDLLSKEFNNTVYRQILLRPRVFVDCKDCDLSTTFLGYKLKLPIFVSPAAMARLAHPDGEWGIAQACNNFGAMQMISNNASMTPEQIVKDAGPDQVFGWQLYVQTDTKKSEDMLARINKLDAIKFICLTLDAPVPGKREHDERGKFDVEDASQAIRDAGGAELKGGGGIGQSLFFGTDPTLTWTKTLPWLKKHTNKPIILKGLQCHEDAYLASQYAPRSAELFYQTMAAGHSILPAIDPHPLEIRKYCPEVLTRLDVVIDGGIKRGTDVVKALALGAKAVGIGRSALFGLGAGGIAGVERVLEILRDETATATRLLGAARVTDLGPTHINTRAVERDIYNGPAELPSPSRGLWTKSKL